MREAEHASTRRRDFPKWTNRIRYWEIGETDKTAPETELPKIESEVDNLVRNLRSPEPGEKDYDALTEFYPPEYFDIIKYSVHNLVYTCSRFTTRCCEPLL